MTRPAVDTERLRALAEYASEIEDSEPERPLPTEYLDALSPDVVLALLDDVEAAERSAGQAWHDLGAHHAGCEHFAEAATLTAQVLVLENERDRFLERLRLAEAVCEAVAAPIYDGEVRARNTADALTAWREAKGGGG